MKQSQRILSAVLALVLLFRLWSPAYGLEGSGVKLTMEASKTSLQIGDTVAVTIRADQDFTTRGSGMTLYYDANKLKLEGASAAAPLRIDPVTVNGRTALRISFLPGADAVPFSADQPLAALRFRALAVTEKTELYMGAAYLYDPALQEIALERPAAVELTIQPYEEPDAGYTVKMPADTSAVIGGTVRLPVIISNADGSTGYNAFDIRFAYDPAVLELTSTTLPGVTVTAQDGMINVLGYGEDRENGSVPFTLEFKALKMETTEVRITEARVDNSGNAVVRNASLAALTDDRTAITVTGYPVTLPEGFIGADTAAPNMDYTFTAPDDHYDYTVTATVGGREADVTENGDGSYTIPAELVTGEIIVTASKTGKTFQVMLGTDMTGPATARYGTDYVATIERDESCRYTVTVTIGGRDYTGYTASGKTYTIPGSDITGEIVFKVTKTEIPRPSEPVTMHPVTFTGSGAGAAQGNAASVAHGGTYTLTLKKQAGYSYHVSYQMGGKAAVAIAPNGKGAYTIANVTAPLEIVIEKTMNLRVSVQEYVTLDEKSVFLILAEAAIGSGNILTYDGDAMYYAESYGAWVWLVIADQEPDGSQVRARVKISPQSKRVIPASFGDVDENGRVNWNDVQLVRDLYNAKHDSFGSVSMARFLRADVNGDRRVDILDAAWVAWKVWEREDGQT